jgi:2-dehydropantoate 2-reductase
VVAARLSRSGADCTVVDANAEHVALLSSPGLRVGGIGGGAPIPLAARVPRNLTAETIAAADLVLLAVRSGATAGALERIASRLRPDTDVVSLQNGLNEDTVAAFVGPERTIGCVVGFGATWIAPGEVSLDADGPLTIGRLDGSSDDRLEAARQTLDGAFRTRTTDNILGALWGKMLVNSTTVLGALGGMLTGDVLGTPERRRTVAAVLAEGVRVAGAEGVELPKVLGMVPPELVEDPEAWHHQADEALQQMATHFGSVKSVTWRDFELGRPTEIDAVTGEILRRGRQRGVDVPHTARAYELLKDIEDGKRSPASSNLEELGAASG